MGFGIGPIPWGSIHDYAKVKRLDEDATELFIDVICAMDVVYLEWEVEEAKNRNKK